MNRRMTALEALTFTMAAVLFLVAPSAYSETVIINRAAPLNWHYAEAGYGGYYYDSGWIPIAGDSLRQDGMGATASSTAPSNTLYSAMSSAAAWNLRGAAQTNGYAGIWSYAEFGDEWYFETSNGQPAIVEFNLDVHVEMIKNPNSTLGWPWLPSLDISLMSPMQTGLGVYLLDEKYFEDTTTATTAFSSVGYGTLYPGEPTFLVASGSYFPISLRAQGTCWYEGFAVDWRNTIQLNPDDPFNVLQPNGQDGWTELTSDQYRLIRQAVAEPASMLLLATGLGGIFLVSWRRKK